MLEAARGAAPGIETIRKTYFSTDDVPERNQFDAFRAQVGATYDISPMDGAGREHQFAQNTIGFGGLTLTSHYKREGSVAVRDEAIIRRDQNDAFIIVCLLSGTSLVESGDSVHHLAPDMLWIRDMARPVRAISQNTRIVNLTAPRALLTRVGADPGSLHARKLQSPMGALFMDHLVSLARNLDSIPASQAARTVEMTELLLAAALATTREKVAEAGKPIDRLLRDRARRYMERNLLSSALTPDSIAASIGVSRRKLYLIFESGGGVMREIQARRLDRAREALADRGRQAKVKEVAFSHGFESEAHFSRSFKRLFGFNPSEAAEIDPQPDGLAGSASREFARVAPDRRRNMIELDE